jgi:multiple antibiotic resistance protein
MTGVITLAVAHNGSKIPVTVLVAIVAVTLGTWLTISLLSRSHDSNGFIRSTIQSFMGLLVMAMGVQFALQGLGNYIQSPGL